MWRGISFFMVGVIVPAFIALLFRHLRVRRELRHNLAMGRLTFNVNEAPLPMLMVNDAGIIIDANAPLRHMFGWTEEELVGKPLAVLLPASVRTMHGESVAGFFASPYARIMGAGKALSGQHRDGHEIPVEVGLSSVRANGGIAVIASVADMSQNRLLEQKQREASALMSSIIRSTPFSIIATDEHGMIIAISPAAEQMLGYTQQELVGGTTPEILHEPEEVAARAAELSQELGEVVEPGFEVFVAKARRGIVEEHEWTYRHKDGTLFPVSLTVTALRGADDEIIGFLGTAYDISERKRNEKYMRFLAHHDELTGLPNRTLLKDRMDMAIHSARRSGRNFAIMMIDLDHFKQINDSLGHHIGDQLLIEVAKRLGACIRNTDTVARLGGDEFVILLADTFNKETVAAIADKVVAEISREMQLEGNVLTISPSIGIAFYPNDGKDLDVLLQNADVAMYAAKQAGRGAARMFCLLTTSRSSG
jgi:diguanylate cyclase (GGDEF)-like protein/PAS domain S-box-containing protein